MAVGLAGTSHADPGDFTMKNMNSGRCLSVPAAATGFEYLNQFSCGGYVDQYWYRQYVETDANGLAWYKIVNRHSGLCLSVDGASKDDYAWITQYPCGQPKPYPDQYWRQMDYDANTGGDHIRNRNSNKCLAILDGSTAEAAWAIQYSCGSWRDHYWKT
ncbi:RICIN domain-containing protein [Streptomyces sp. NPDC001728]|uniref:RICIN domain-containing protein n=1 Tax=Streptomyces sp. NPDC001728 TaxID=3154396 RepID=UPI003326AF20